MTSNVMRRTAGGYRIQLLQPARKVNGNTRFHPPFRSIPLDLESEIRQAELALFACLEMRPHLRGVLFRQMPVHVLL